MEQGQNKATRSWLKMASPKAAQIHWGILVVQIYRWCSTPQQKAMLLSSVCVTVVEGRNFCCCDASIVLLKPHKAKLLLQDHLLLHRPYKQLFKPGFYKYEMSYDVATLWAIFYFFSPNNSFFFRVQIRSKKLMTTQQVACLSDHVLKLE